MKLFLISRCLYFFHLFSGSQLAYSHLLAAAWRSQQLVSMSTITLADRAANEPSAKFSQSRRRPLLGPYAGCSRGLLRDCENFAEGSFASLLPELGGGGWVGDLVADSRCLDASRQEVICPVLIIWFFAAENMEVEKDPAEKNQLFSNTLYIYLSYWWGFWSVDV